LIHERREAGEAMLALVRERLDNLLFEGRGTTIPEERDLITYVEERGSISRSRLATNADGNRLSIGKRCVRPMAGGATDCSVRAQPRVEKECLPKRD
jgi:hypothetical protein